MGSIIAHNVNRRTSINDFLLESGGPLLGSTPAPLGKSSFPMGKDDAITVPGPCTKSQAACGVQPVNGIGCDDISYSVDRVGNRESGSRLDNSPLTNIGDEDSWTGGHAAKSTKLASDGVRKRSAAGDGVIRRDQPPCKKISIDSNVFTGVTKGEVTARGSLPDAEGYARVMGKPAGSLENSLTCHQHSNDVPAMTLAVRDVGNRSDKGSGYRHGEVVKSDHRGWGNVEEKPRLTSEEARKWAAAGIGGIWKCEQPPKRLSFDMHGVTVKGVMDTSMFGVGSPPREISSSFQNCVGMTVKAKPVAPMAVTGEAEKVNVSAVARVPQRFQQQLGVGCFKVRPAPATAAVPTFPAQATTMAVPPIHNQSQCEAQGTTLFSLTSSPSYPSQVLSPHPTIGADERAYRSPVPVPVSLNLHRQGAHLQRVPSEAVPSTSLAMGTVSAVGIFGDECVSRAAGGSTAATVGRQEEEDVCTEIYRLYTGNSDDVNPDLKHGQESMNALGKIECKHPLDNGSDLEVSSHSRDQGLREISDGGGTSPTQVVRSLGGGMRAMGASDGGCESRVVTCSSGGFRVAPAGDSCLKCGGRGSVDGGGELGVDGGERCSTGSGSRGVVCSYCGSLANHSGTTSIHPLLNEACWSANSGDGMTVERELGGQNRSSIHDNLSSQGMDVGGNGGRGREVFLDPIMPEDDLHELSLRRSPTAGSVDVGHGDQEGVDGLDMLMRAEGGDFLETDTAACMRTLQESPKHRPSEPSTQPSKLLAIANTVGFSNGDGGRGVSGTEVGVTGSDDDGGRQMTEEEVEEDGEEAGGEGGEGGGEEEGREEGGGEEDEEEEEEEEDDDDDDDDDEKVGPRVGEEHQAVIPDLLKKGEFDHLQRPPSLCLWSPSTISDAAAAVVFPTPRPGGSGSANLEQRMVSAQLLARAKVEAGHCRQSVGGCGGLPSKVGELGCRGGSPGPGGVGARKEIGAVAAGVTSSWGGFRTGGDLGGGYESVKGNFGGAGVTGGSLSPLMERKGRGRVMQEWNYDNSLGSLSALVNSSEWGSEKSWREEDRALFRRGVFAFRRDFGRIRSRFLPHKTHREIVAYFYRCWKTDPAYPSWKACDLVGRQVEKPLTRIVRTPKCGGGFNEHTEALGVCRGVVVSKTSRDDSRDGYDHFSVRFRQPPGATWPVTEDIVLGVLEHLLVDDEEDEDMSYSGASRSGDYSCHHGRFNVRDGVDTSGGGGFGMVGSHGRGGGCSKHRRTEEGDEEADDEEDEDEDEGGTEEELRVDNRPLWTGEAVGGNGIKVQVGTGGGEEKVCAKVRANMARKVFEADRNDHLQHACTTVQGVREGGGREGPDHQLLASCSVAGDSWLPSESHFGGEVGFGVAVKGSVVPSVSIEARGSAAEGVSTSDINAGGCVRTGGKEAGGGTSYDTRGSVLPGPVGGLSVVPLVPLPDEEGVLVKGQGSGVD